MNWVQGLPSLSSCNQPIGRYFSGLCAKRTLNMTQQSGPMSSLSLHTPHRPLSTPTQGFQGAKRLHAALFSEHGRELGEIDEVTRSTSRSFLASQLESAAAVDSDMPADPRHLSGWLTRSHEESTRAYRDYLDGRRSGAPRRFFLNRSHALYFLNAVAPTKLVDGSWLYGLVSRWNDPRMLPLVRIYLDELGDGVASQNHVLLYRQLLAQHGGERWHDLDDAHHVQGAIQLSLAHHAAEFLPEVIGFNLGYEQLPLHLPITAYELNELDVDPWYFSLHLTIDNASTGHARKALQSALECLPRAGDAASFYRRLVNGFKLNDVGMGTMEAIASFDLEQELAAVLSKKALVGAQLHSDYCRIGGRTVADWLSVPGGMPAFLQALVDARWIQRGAEPENSRFWHLLNGDKASMFGVFDAYEMQLIADWIRNAPAGASGEAVRGSNVNRFRRRVAAGQEGIGDGRLAPVAPSVTRTSVAAVVRHQVKALHEDTAGDEDVQVLVGRLAEVDEVGAAMAGLRGFLSPANHTTPAGLLAARICAGVVGR